jgi:hypothetical protein
MLDLDAIFDPEQPPTTQKAKPAPVADSDIRVEDLDPDWRVEWEERAAIIEYDGKMPRERAEALALTGIVARMRQTPVRSDCPCRACRGGGGDACV